MGDPDRERGTHYADGGATWAPVYWPDPKRMAELDAEWAEQEPVDGWKLCGD